jgi:hypothetical protein
MREVKVYVGLDLDAAGIRDALNETDQDGNDNTLLFDVAHTLLTEHKDDRAEVHSVEVSSVSQDEEQTNLFYIDFETSWSAHYGCRDMDEAGLERESESATYSDGFLIFTVPTPRRPAGEC